MKGIESARHDLSDARFSVDTAIDLLSSIRQDLNAEELRELIIRLTELKSGLDETYERLINVQEKYDA